MRLFGALYPQTWRTIRHVSPQAQLAMFTVS
jgi:hypothetical protein